MATLRRGRFFVRFFVWLLAGLLVLGSGPSSAAFWQCRYAACVVPAPLAAPGVMPCRMTDAPMPRMACCPPLPAAAAQSAVSVKPAKPAFPHSAFTAPPCRPALTLLTASLVCFRAADTPALRLAFLCLQCLPLAAFCLPAAPNTLCLQPRPPPISGCSLSFPLRTPGLRAPPAA